MSRRPFSSAQSRPSAWSLSTRRRILPEADFGMASTNVSLADLLVAGDLLGDEALGCRSAVASCPGLSTTYADGDLARLVVGQPDHGGVGDCGVGEQQRLELGRRHLEALVLDELLEPVDDEEVAVGVDVADVAGVQPAVVVDRVRRRRSLFEVALHHLRAAHPHLAVFVDAERRSPWPGRRCCTSVFGTVTPTEPGLNMPGGVAWLTGDSSVMP